jgi:DNA-binding transcriptional ArsR family regulator
MPIAGASGEPAPTLLATRRHNVVDAPRSIYYRLVMNISPAQLDATFAALADPTRRAILARLAAGDASVNELAQPFAMSQPAISKHLKVLERAGLVSRGKDAQRRPRKLEAIPLAQATEWLEEYRRHWDASFARLDGLLEEMKRTTAPRGRTTRKKKER